MEVTILTAIGTQAILTIVETVFIIVMGGVLHTIMEVMDITIHFTTTTLITTLLIIMEAIIITTTMEITITTGGIHIIPTLRIMYLDTGGVSLEEIDT
tara:strand:- start:160 stop:453 length:294 start_codon:yes stop_codon:yes gene_type:complete